MAITADQLRILHAAVPRSSRTGAAIATAAITVLAAAAGTILTVFAVLAAVVTAPLAVPIVLAVVHRRGRGARLTARRRKRLRVVRTPA